MSNESALWKTGHRYNPKKMFTRRISPGFIEFRKGGGVHFCGMSSLCGTDLGISYAYYLM